MKSMEVQRNNIDNEYKHIKLLTIRQRINVI